jgi:TrpR-related protein YerC/YecD
MPPKKRFTDDSYRKEPWFKALTQALLSCKTEEGMMDLLRDLGTLSELQAWSERLEVAKQLSKGLSYREVAALTGASTTTVTRVAKFIENGPGGYRALLHVHRHHRLLPTKEKEDKKKNGAHEEAKKPEHISVMHKYFSHTDSPAAS